MLTFFLCSSILFPKSVSIPLSNALNFLVKCFSLVFFRDVFFLFQLKQSPLFPYLLIFVSYGSRRSSYYRGPEGCPCRGAFLQSVCRGLRREGWVRCERRSLFPQPVLAAVTSVEAGLETREAQAEPGAGSSSPSRRHRPSAASVSPELLEQKPRVGSEGPRSPDV